ncbi:MarR family winged helix-turn-helix transcriptional regulator [Virgibacillus soli]|uniref:MarR family transcriptional regulator n=1 Tax=Paracerasibacillus soli TaxID=480284 RepID=A0ABU5CNG6_9BACI|nr:MarR family transcriptional regulator [Virgibacillus soli]MDY0407780.1 MarR family transcriptional regulator [Virgibacillus soli]
MELKVLADRYQVAMNTVFRGVNHIMKEKVHSDITTDQFATLQYIQQHDQCTSTEISHAFGVGKSAVTNQVNRLVNKGLVYRTRDESDRRNVYLHITEKGSELVQYTEKELYTVLEPLLGHFSNEEILTFIEALERLALLMEDYDKRN